MKCKTDLANPVTFNGLQLELERCQHIHLQATFRPPMHRSRSGAFVHFTEQQLALHTMACLGNDVCVHKVRVQRLVHAGRTLDTVVTAGVFEKFLPITITAPWLLRLQQGAEVEEEVGEPVEEPVEGQEGMQAPLTSCFFSMLSRGWWHGAPRVPLGTKLMQNLIEIQGMQMRS